MLNTHRTIEAVCLPEDTPVGGADPATPPTRAMTAAATVAAHVPHTRTHACIKMLCCKHGVNHPAHTML